MVKGDKVSYVITRRVRGGFSISSKEGVIESVGHDGMYAVKAKNGAILWVDRGSVRPIGKPNALTEALFPKEA